MPAETTTTQQQTTRMTIAQPLPPDDYGNDERGDDDIGNGDITLQLPTLQSTN